MARGVPLHGDKLKNKQTNQTTTTKQVGDSTGERALSEVVGGLCKYKDLLGAMKKCQAVALESPINKTIQRLLPPSSPPPAPCLLFISPCSALEVLGASTL